MYENSFLFAGNRGTRARIFFFIAIFKYSRPPGSDSAPEIPEEQLGATVFGQNGAAAAKHQAHAYPNGGEDEQRQRNGEQLVTTMVTVPDVVVQEM